MYHSVDSVDGIWSLPHCPTSRRIREAFAIRLDYAQRFVSSLVFPSGTLGVGGGVVVHVEFEILGDAPLRRMKDVTAGREKGGWLDTSVTTELVCKPRDNECACRATLDTYKTRP